MAMAFSIFASSIGGMSSPGPSSFPPDTLAKIDICRFSFTRLHFGQFGIRSVLADLAKKL